MRQTAVPGIMAADSTMPCRVSKPEFGELVQRTLAEIPEPFASMLEEIAIEVMDRPTPDLIRRSHLGRGHTLLGLYVGHPLTQRSVQDSGIIPDVIYIFQEPIESICRDRNDLCRQIRITVLHEIGHHFGMDEADLDRLGYR
jgi:predicted Zn-dependent protease with MMP-like domain